MADRFVVKNAGVDSTVTDITNGSVVFAGPYDKAVSNADELNRQFADNTNQNTAAPTSGANDDSPKTGPAPILQPGHYDANGKKLTSDELRELLNSPAGNAVVAGTPSTVAGSAGSGVDVVAKQNKNQRPGSRPYNPLSEFSSSTYNISLYMLTPAAYNTFIANGGKKPESGAYVVAQSGGLNAQDKLKRVNGLDYDLYIDDLKITSVMSYKQTNSATNSLGFEFHIYEPYGFSFTTILQEAASKLQADSGFKSNIDIFDPARQVYLLEVNFTGYGADGLPKTVTLDNLGSAPKQSNNFNRLWAIKFESFGFKITGKITQYTIKAVPWSVQTSYGAKYGFVNNPVELKGETVKDIINGKSKVALNQTPAQPVQGGGGGRGAPPPDTPLATQSAGVSVATGVQNITGLIEALNKAEEMLVKNGGATVANIYEVEIAEEIANSKMVSQGEIAKSKAAMNAVSKTIESNSYASQTANAAQVNKRTVSIPAGMSIVQVIDRVIGQSSYVLDSLKVLQKESAEAETEKQDSKLKLKWYNVNPIVTIIGDKPDPKRQDYAYKIKYVITPYEIPFVRSVFLDGKSDYYGPHKVYKYYFTGENSEVLAFEQSFNYLYFTAGPSDLPANSKDGVPNVPNRQQGGDKGGAFNNASQGPASLRSNLYNPGDLANATMTVIGDPDYLVTSIGVQTKDPFNTFYGDDYTINPNGGQVFIEIIFYEGMDYDNSKGIQMINNKIYFYPYPEDIQKRVQGVVYNVKYVDSMFSRGKFTQELDLYLWNPGTNNKSNSTPNGGASQEREAESTDATGSRTRSMTTTPSPAEYSQASVRSIDNAIEALKSKVTSAVKTVPTGKGTQVQDDDAAGGTAVYYENDGTSSTSATYYENDGTRS